MLAALLAQHEIDRVCGNLPQLGLIAEGALEHGQSARHGDDVVCGDLGLSLELASRDTLRQGFLNESGDASDQIREGLPRVLIQPFIAKRNRRTWPPPRQRRRRGGCRLPIVRRDRRVLSRIADHRRYRLSKPQACEFGIPDLRKRNYSRFVFRNAQELDVGSRNSQFAEWVVGCLAHGRASELLYSEL